MREGSQVGHEQLVSMTRVLLTDLGLYFLRFNRSQLELTSTTAYSNEAGIYVYASRWIPDPLSPHSRSLLHTILPLPASWSDYVGCVGSSQLSTYTVSFSDERVWEGAEKASSRVTDGFGVI
jgi:hypothetical protein